MVAPMGHRERALAALAGEPVDRLSVYPIACGLCRKLLPDKPTYREWSNNPKIMADAYVAGQKYFGLDYCIGLADLSIAAGDFGAKVKMDEENTPMIEEHLIHDLEDYEKIVAPSCTEGRSGIFLEAMADVVKRLKDEVVVAPFVEGPLLVLSQTAGAEQLFMDMFTDEDVVLKAMEVTTGYCCELASVIGDMGADGVCWDYLWGNYAVLGDEEYHKFEADKFAKKVNDTCRENDLAVAIHNCADLPHLDTQINQYKADMYSMAYYPLVDGSPTAAQVIADGYADHCVVAGTIDPQMFVRSTAEETFNATKDLCQSVKTALCEKGLNSTYCISTNCEVPPVPTVRMENITAMVDAVKQYGTF